MLQTQKKESPPGLTGKGFFLLKQKSTQDTGF